VEGANCWFVTKARSSAPLLPQSPLIVLGGSPAVNVFQTPVCQPWLHQICRGLPGWWPRWFTAAVCAFRNVASCGSRTMHLSPAALDAAIRLL